MTSEGGRRAVYFAFQGLFMAVLLLLVVFQRGRSLDGASLGILAGMLMATLATLRLATEAALSRWWFSASLFIGDALAAAATLHRLRPRQDLFLLYVMIVFGSALTRSASQRLAVAGAAIVLYLISGWNMASGWPGDTEFWMRVMFLAVSAALMALLAQDTRQAQEEHRRRYEERLIQVGRLATLGRVAGEVAHRIKSPLTTISVDAEVLAHRLAGDKPALRELAEISGEVERCKAILKSLLDLGRIEEMDVVALDLREPARRALKAVETQAKSRRVAVTSSGFAAPLRARGDETLLQEAVSALLQNALESVVDGGAIRVELSTRGRARRIAVLDDGVGIRSEDLERVFEPFFTTKKGEGSGLGLSAALRIAAKHGGTIEADSPGPGRGAKFTLVIPAA